MMYSPEMRWNRSEHRRGLAGLQESMIAVNLTCACATIVLNVMTCLAIYKVKGLRSPSNSLLVSLSIADLLVVVEFTSWLVFLGIKDNHGLHDQKRGLCVYIAPYHYTVMSIIILHLAAISIDRLLAIKWHMRYPILVTNTRMVGAIVTLWCLGILTSVLPMMLSSEDSQHEMKDFTKVLLGCARPKVTCIRSWLKTVKLEKENSLLPRPRWNKTLARESSLIPRWNKANKTSAMDISKQYVLYGLISNFALPFLAIVVSYSCILKTSMAQYKKIKAQEIARGARKRTEMRAANTVAIIIVCFLICFAPMFTTTVVQIYARPCWKERILVNTFLVLVSSLSAILNPLIYVGRNESFRNAFKKILRLSSKTTKEIVPSPGKPIEEGHASKNTAIDQSSRVQAKDEAEQDTKT